MNLSAITGAIPAANLVDPTAASDSSDDSTAATSSAAAPSNALLAPNQFLSLLVDSLKYQDPLDPTSSADFLQQLASLSQVQTETQVDQTDQTSAAANLIGHTITGDDPTGLSVTGVATGFTITANGPVLDVGNDSVALGDISTVGPAPADPSSSTTLAT